MGLPLKAFSASSNRQLQASTFGKQLIQVSSSHSLFSHLLPFSYKQIQQSWKKKNFFSLTRYHHSHFTDSANEENEYSLKHVFIAQEQREMTCFLITLMWFTCITRGCERRKLLFLSNDIHPSRKSSRKRAGLGRKSLASTNQQGGTGDKRDTTDYFSFKSATWGRDCLVTKDYSIFSVLHQQLCSSLLLWLWSKYAQLVFS